MKKRIAIDMDEVMADLVTRELEWYKRDCGIDITYKQLMEAGKHLYYFVTEEHQEIIKANWYKKGFFADLPVIENAVEVIRELNDKYEIFVTTAAMPFPNSFIEKQEWLLKHLDFIPVEQHVFCGHKRIINADYMIDDKSFNFDNFVGEGLLFTSCHNVYEKENGFKRVNNWLEVKDYLL